VLVEAFIAFHLPRGLRSAVRTRDVAGFFGHVEAFGITAGGDWLFIDPHRRRMDVRVLYRMDEVEAAIAQIHATADLILAVDPVPGPILPPLMPMTCAAVCAHLVGTRAFTLGGLERKLRAIGAREVKNAEAEGRRGGEKGARA
jgi:hypothetical protein